MLLEKCRPRPNNCATAFCRPVRPTTALGLSLMPMAVVAVVASLALFVIFCVMVVLDMSTSTRTPLPSLIRACFISSNASRHSASGSPAALTNSIRFPLYVMNCAYLAIPTVPPPYSNQALCTVSRLTVHPTSGTRHAGRVPQSQTALAALVVFLHQPFLGLFDSAGEVDASSEQLRHRSLQPRQAHNHAGPVYNAL